MGGRRRCKGAEEEVKELRRGCRGEGKKGRAEAMERGEAQRRSLPFCFLLGKTSVAVLCQVLLDDWAAADARHCCHVSVCCRG
ncbi:hypothetical protein MRB53_019792 [Persea americana]|uniref:Uncharacterized protein n=1 Tax=Persea americana TaxID=3435 RepID=A0ACC2KZJ3_PERAE|nr:hypothetical protein MRB53_019792 [Persea americana]